MKLNTPYLGEVEYNLNEIIIFDKGLYGFEGKQEFILVNLEDPEFPFNCLQSIDDEDLSFVLTSPFLFVNNYEFDLSDILIEELEIKNHEDVLILTTVVLNEDLEKSTMNLQAPIVINRNTNKGRQIILEEEYELKYKFLLKKESN